MRSKTVTRYYCDYCSKGMFRKPDMARHEEGCTLNPKRTCYLCQNNSGECVEDLAALAVTLKDEYKGSESMNITAEDLHRIRNATEGCPSCILSILRQAGIYAFDVFDYKKELAEWRKEETIEKYGSLTREF
jgi:hypothetical protein